MFAGRRKFIRSLCVLGFILCAAPASACLQGSEDFDLAHVRSEYAEAIQKHKPEKYWNQRLLQLKPQIHKDSSGLIGNDYAVALAHTRHYAAALRLLKAIERRKPGLYPTAANLGTVYELLGNDSQALKWIREGIRRKPDSHRGTEWLHVRILQAKLALAKDKNWLQNHSVLGMNFGPGVQPQAPKNLPTGNSGQALDLDEVTDALEYQLHERIEFVGPPNPVVADLLGDFGNSLLVDGDIEEAAGIYQLALKYSPVHVQLIRARLASLGPRSYSKDDATADNFTAVTLIGGAVLAFWVGVILLRWRHKRRARVQPA